MKEQIEEMRKDLIEIFDEEYEKRRLITPDFTAEKMTAKGYRKQREGEWIYRENEFGNAYYACSICDCQTRYKENYCSSCGARMKGGAE